MKETKLRFTATPNVQHNEEHSNLAPLSSTNSNQEFEEAITDIQIEQSSKTCAIL